MLSLGADLSAGRLAQLATSPAALDNFTQSVKRTMKETNADGVELVATSISSATDKRNLEEVLQVGVMVSLSGRCQVGVNDVCLKFETAK